MPDPSLPDNQSDDAAAERRRQHVRLYLTAVLIVLVVVAIVQIFGR